MGDEYGGGIVAIADSVSGELVIVPDAEALETITGNFYYWEDAKLFAESYSDGVNSDYRSPTKAEAFEILTNGDLLSQLGLPTFTRIWTIEEIDAGNAYAASGIGNIVFSDYKDMSHFAFPVRKVNFYGLPLIESEFGGGLVYDVVAETRTVHVVAEWADVISFDYGDMCNWDDAVGRYPDIIGADEFTSMPTRAQALKIFGNSYLVTLAGLPLDNNYWTSEEIDALNAYCWATGDNEIQDADKTNLHYALPVRSEVVPES